MRTFRNRLSIVVALALGWIIGGFSASSPTAVAQVARVTLDSLQRQITQIIDGTTAVGNAIEANHTVQADFAIEAAFAIDAAQLNGKPAENYVTAADLNDVLGPVLRTAGAGLTANAEVVGVNFDALDAEYLPRTGGTITGDLSVTGGVRVGQLSSTPTPGMLGFAGGKLRVFDGISWIPLH